MKEKINIRTAVNLLYLVLLVNLISCSQDEEIAIDEVIEIETPDWTEQSHGDKAEPDYQLIFPDDKVNRINIKIEPENWQKMQADLASKDCTNENRHGQQDQQAADGGGHALATFELQETGEAVAE